MARTNRLTRQRRFRNGVHENHDYIAVTEVAQILNRTTARIYQMLNDYPNFRKCWIILGGSDGRKFCSCRALEKYLSVPKEERDPEKCPGEIEVSKKWITAQEAARRIGVAGMPSVLWLLDHDREFADCAWYFGGSNLAFNAEMLDEYAALRKEKFRSREERDRLAEMDFLERVRYQRERSRQIRSEASKKAWESRKRKEQEEQDGVDA